MSINNVLLKQSSQNSVDTVKSLWENPWPAKLEIFTIWPSNQKKKKKVLQHLEHLKNQGLSLFSCARRKDCSLQNFFTGSTLCRQPPRVCVHSVCSDRHSYRHMNLLAQHISLALQCHALGAKSHTLLIYYTCKNCFRFTIIDFKTEDILFIVI